MCTQEKEKEFVFLGRIKVNDKWRIVCALNKIYTFWSAVQNYTRKNNLTVARGGETRRKKNTNQTDNSQLSHSQHAYGLFTSSTWDKKANTHNFNNGNGKENANNVLNLWQKIVSWPFKRILTENVHCFTVHLSG